MEDEHEEEAFEDVPEHMREWLINMPTMKPEEYERGISEMWMQFEEGKCMCCGVKLGPHTTVVVNASGLAAAFCTGACATDMANIGFLQEHHDDLLDRIKFRGQGDKADGGE